MKSCPSIFIHSIHVKLDVLVFKQGFDSVWCTASCKMEYSFARVPIGRLCTVVQQIIDVFLVSRIIIYTLPEAIPLIKMPSIWIIPKIACTNSTSADSRFGRTSKSFRP